MKISTSERQKRPSMMLPKLKLILTTLTRLVGVAYIVIAGFSIPESLKLLEESYTKEGDTLYVPLLVCEPVRASSLRSVVVVLISVLATDLLLSFFPSLASTDRD